jgi:putative FmdB family regulatory protein
VPTYQYACTECGHDFEQVQAFSDASLTVCPECDGKLRKVFNAVGVVFKGSGFYRNDSRSASSTSDAPAASKDSGAAKSGDSGSGSSGESSSNGSGSKDSGSKSSGSKETSSSSSSGSSTTKTSTSS